MPRTSHGGLGRLPSQDERDRQFPLMAAIPHGLEPLTRRYWWNRGWAGDQGQTSMCVAFAWCHFLGDGPVTSHPLNRLVPVVDPAALYKEAQGLDEWPGENYDGTSVRGGAKALAARGYIGAYRWGTTVEDLKQGVLHLGPCVIGTNWTEGMDTPDPKGFLHYTGGVLGGHAYLINGVNVREEKFRMKNSWGLSWGDAGHAWIRFEDMARLIADDGEVCVATEIKR